MLRKTVCTIAVFLFGVCLSAQSGYMGVAFENAPPESPLRGVTIRWIASDGPAAAAGLQIGDLIKAIDGQAVATPRAAQMVVLAHKPGDVLTFNVLRQGPSGYRESRIKVTLGSAGGTQASSGGVESQPVAARGTTNSAAAHQAAATEGNIRY